MQIDLSKKEIELLDEALRAWEGEPVNGSLLSGIMATVMCSGSDTGGRREVRKEAEAHMVESEKKGKERRIVATMMRAKLFQALTRESEHDVETPG